MDIKTNEEISTEDDLRSAKRAAEGLRPILNKISQSPVSARSSSNKRLSRSSISSLNSFDSSIFSSETPTKKTRKLKKKYDVDSSTDNDEDMVKSSKKENKKNYKICDDEFSFDLSKQSDDILVTDITSGLVTVTIKESNSPEGFFRKRDNN